ncbi:MAG: hypothetical protein WA584_07870 [Pyrinomonadaceae bacterium]
MSENTINENERATSAEDKNANNTPATNAAANEQATSESENANSQKTEAAQAAIIKIEGQEIPLDAAIAADDNLLKTALSPYYPSIKNAQITRETRNGQMIVSIVKKAEHKGSGRR